MERSAVTSTAATASVGRGASVWILLALAFGIRLYWLMASHPTVIDNEGAQYARLADSLRTGHYFNLEGAVSPGFPPLYPLLIALVSSVTGNAETAGRIVSLIAGSAFVLPVYALTKLVYGRQAALASGSIVALLPYFVQLSTSVLSEMTFVTLTITGIFFALRSYGSRSLRDALLCGVAFGLAAITRQEGLLYGGVAAALVALVSLFGGRLRITRAFRLGAGVLVPLLLLLAPYAVYIRDQTGHLPFANKFSQNYSADKLVLDGMPLNEANLRIGPNLEPLGPELANYPADAAVAGPPNLRAASVYAAAAARRHITDLHYFLWSPTQGTLILSLLAIVGLVAGGWSRLRVLQEAGLIVFFLTMFSTLLATQHFWDRYGAQFLALIAVWGGGGVSCCYDFASRVIPAPRRRPGSFVRVWSAGVIVAVAALFITTRGAVADAGTHDAIERDAGAWLRNQPPAAKSVMESEAAIPYYAVARWATFPYADGASALRYVRNVHPDYVVLVRSHEQVVPYLAAWIEHGLPPGDAERVFDRHYGDGERVVIYRWRAADGRRAL